MAQPGSWFWLKKKKFLGSFWEWGGRLWGWPGGPSESLCRECVGGAVAF